MYKLVLPYFRISIISFVNTFKIITLFRNMGKTLQPLKPLKILNGSGLDPNVPKMDFTAKTQPFDFVPKPDNGRDGLGYVIVPKSIEGKQPQKR